VVGSLAGLPYDSVIESYCVLIDVMEFAFVTIRSHASCVSET